MSVVQRCDCTFLSLKKARTYGQQGEHSTHDTEWDGTGLNRIGCTGWDEMGLNRDGMYGMARWDGSEVGRREV